MKGQLPANWKAHVADKLAALNTKAETVTTRKASQIAINALASALPEFLGGSADLTGSNLTNWEGCHPVRHGNPGPPPHPVDQPAPLRMIPNIDVWRPCDTGETMVGWVASVERRTGPPCHIL